MHYIAIMNIYDEIKKHSDTFEAIREDIHSNPELSFKEFRTTEIIRNFCKDLGLEIVDIGMDTGVVAVLYAENDKKSDGAVALRADIDAVNTDYGAAHVCGHDFHTVSLMCCAKFLCENKNLLKRDVIFIFQPAEEVTQGAKSMLSHGLMEKLPTKPVMLFGIHNRPEIPLGKIRVQEGALMAVKSDFKIALYGKVGHSGSPHQCIDPIVASASIISSVQTIVSRNVNPFSPCVCAVCSVHSGTADNFAPENAVLTGSVRALDETVHDTCLRRVEEICKNTAVSYNCDVDFEIIPQVPMIYNSVDMTKYAKKAALATVGKENIVQTPPCLGSEDFAVFGKEIPSFFYWVGSGTASENNAPWHSKGFKVADGYIEISATLLANCAIL